MLVGWNIIYFGYQFFESAQQSKMAKLKAESLVKDAELIALKAQINPHFIFNSLNNIRAMVLEDPMKARDMISNLSELLRYSIQFSNEELVPLKTEIEIVEDYLKLETVQYENRLEYNLDIDQATRDLKIPPMIVQLQVENAIKHGISRLPEGGAIHVKTQLDNSNLVIIVSNTGKINKQSDNGGIGLRNAMERIKHLFDVEPNFSLSEKDGMVTSHLIFPVK
jgi:LytS/YehU family sensor histidine kinase